MSYVLGIAFWGQKGGYCFVVDLQSKLLTAHCVPLMPSIFSELILFDLMVVTDVIQNPSKHGIAKVAFTFKAFGFL